jgi:hypothetical protein
VGALLVSFCSCLLSQIYFSISYGDTARAVPQPEKGWIYPITVKGFVRYVSRQEFVRYDVAIHKLLLPEFIVVAVLVALRIRYKEL